MLLTSNLNESSKNWGLLSLVFSEVAETTLVAARLGQFQQLLKTQVILNLTRSHANRNSRIGPIYTHHANTTHNMQKSNAHPSVTQAAWLTRFLYALKSLEPATYHFSPNYLLETFKAIAITKHQQGEEFKCNFLNVPVEILGKPRIVIWEKQKRKIHSITKLEENSTVSCSPPPSSTPKKSPCRNPVPPWGNGAPRSMDTAPLLRNKRTRSPRCDVGLPVPGSQWVGTSEIAKCARKSRAKTRVHVNPAWCLVPFLRPEGRPRWG